MRDPILRTDRHYASVSDTPVSGHWGINKHGTHGHFSRRSSTYDNGKLASVKTTNISKDPA